MITQIFEILGVLPPRNVLLLVSQSHAITAVRVELVQERSRSSGEQPCASVSSTVCNMESLKQ